MRDDCAIWTPTGFRFESALSEQHRALLERQRADIAQQRADLAQHRADSEHQRAERLAPCCSRPNTAFCSSISPRPAAPACAPRSKGLRWRDPWYYPMFLCSRFSHLSGHRIATKLPRHAKVVAAKELLPKSISTACSSSPSCAIPGISRSAPSITSGANARSISADTRPSRISALEARPGAALSVSHRYLDHAPDRLSDRSRRHGGRGFHRTLRALHEDFATVCERIGIRPPPYPTRVRPGIGSATTAAITATRPPSWSRAISRATSGCSTTASIPDLQGLGTRSR
jgi:hypothetical protein